MFSSSMTCVHFHANNDCELTQAKVRPYRLTHSLIMRASSCSASRSSTEAHGTQKLSIGQAGRYHTGSELTALGHPTRMCITISLKCSNAGRRRGGTNNHMAAAAFAGTPEDPRQGVLQAKKDVGFLNIG